MGGALLVVGGAGAAGGFSRDGPDARPVGDCGNLGGLGEIFALDPRGFLVGRGCLEKGKRGSVRACV